MLCRHKNLLHVLFHADGLSLLGSCLVRCHFTLLGLGVDQQLHDVMLHPLPQHFLQNRFQTLQHLLTHLFECSAEGLSATDHVPDCS